MVNRSDIETTVQQACRDDRGRMSWTNCRSLWRRPSRHYGLRDKTHTVVTAQPIIVLELEGSRPVLAALPSLEQGAFA
jgi:hypothetical protein